MSDKAVPVELDHVGGMSLERKIPLMTTVVLLAILSAGVILSYREVRRAADYVTTHRVEQVAKELATLVASSRARYGDRLLPITRDSAVHRALVAKQPSSRDVSAIKRALAELEGPTDSALVSELRATDGRIIARAGEADPYRGRPAMGVTSTGTDSLSISGFYPFEDRVYFWTTMPVRAEGVLLGTIAQRRRLNSQPEAERNIAKLVGQDVRILFHNSDKSVWTTLAGKPVPPPENARPGANGTTYDHPAVIPSGRALVYEAAVGGFPWVVAIELPTALLGAGSKDILYRFSTFAAVLLLIGAAMLWIVSRQITAPLRKLTTAAQQVAKGDYSQRVSLHGGYEIARLGSTFNRMAAEVAAAHQDLSAAADTAESAKRSAEEANAAKGNFLAAMSHELRTPLNAIAGYVELLRMGIRGPITDEQDKDLERIKRSQTYLLGLIEEVLVFTQLDARQMTFRIEDVPVDALMRDAQEMVEPQIRARGLDYSYEGCDPGLTVHADKDKTQQIVLNLLANGAKYTDRGGRIALACGAVNGSVHVKVSDTGTGIPEERLQEIFEPFVQADRRLNQPRDGVGLGLTISRDLARAMGGDIMVESAVGVGSTFTLVLPRKV